MHNEFILIKNLVQYTFFLPELWRKPGTNHGKLNIITVNLCGNALIRLLKFNRRLSALMILQTTNIYASKDRMDDFLALHSTIAKDRLMLGYPVLFCSREFHVMSYSQPLVRIPVPDRTCWILRFSVSVTSLIILWSNRTYFLTYLIGRFLWDKSIGLYVYRVSLR